MGSETLLYMAATLVFGALQIEAFRTRRSSNPEAQRIRRNAKGSRVSRTPPA